MEGSMSPTKSERKMTLDEMIATGSWIASLSSASLQRQIGQRGQSIDLSSDRNKGNTTTTSQKNSPMPLPKAS